MGKHTEEKHGMSHTVTYKSWQDMKSRCTNPNNKSYKDYGGRGINICATWLNSFMTFLKDMGERPIGDYSLDRIDNSLDYSSSNCRWATRKEQNVNTRRNIKFNGFTAQETSLKLGGGKKLVAKRIADGWSIEKAFTQPLTRSNGKLVIIGTPKK